MKGIKSIAITLMIIGVLVLLAGFYFSFMQWPDLFNGKISGSVLLILGFVLFIVYKIKRK